MQFIRWTAFSFPFVSLWFLSGCCCASTTTERFSYNSDSQSYRSDSGGANLSIGPTKTRRRSGETGAEVVWREPYVLNVTATTSDEYPQPIQILAAEIEHQGKVIVVHARDSAPLTSAWKQNPHSKEYRSSIDMPLNAKLSYVEGSTATGQVIVKLPWDSHEIFLKRVFTAEHEEWSGSLLDGWMGI
jgi:hypothetical protein